MNYSDKWDLSTIPHDRFKSEWARRNATKPRANRCGHNPEQPEDCALCRERIRLREFRKRQAEVKRKDRKK
jgi:hypothetical protein